MPIPSHRHAYIYMMKINESLVKTSDDSPKIAHPALTDDAISLPRSAF